MSKNNADNLMIVGIIFWIVMAHGAAAASAAQRKTADDAPSLALPGSKSCGHFRTFVCGCPKPL